MGMGCTRGSTLGNGAAAGKDAVAVEGEAAGAGAARDVGLGGLAGVVVVLAVAHAAVNCPPAFRCVCRPCAGAGDEVSSSLARMVASCFASCFSVQRFQQEKNSRQQNSRTAAAGWLESYSNHQMETAEWRPKNTPKRGKQR
jgi:hypothetical protein